MPSWKGNIQTTVPNSLQEPMDRSEKIILDNRANEIRRDTDSQKNFTITLYDIDETILLHLEQLQLQIEDVGKQIKVPIFYGSPEKWTSAQRDGYIRDNQGKLILPAIILKRTNSEKDTTLQFFNRYLNTQVRKLYSQKNKYTKFSTLNGQNAPINEIYNVIVPNHMVLTYHFIIWTEKVEQMNELVSAIQFNSKDYWGSNKGFRFRTTIDSYSHTVELQADDDRVVKTEFDLKTHGYILPDTFVKLEKHQSTFDKSLSPKKIVMGVEVVDTGFSKTNKNKQKWRNLTYPNLQKDTVIPTPPVTFDPTLLNNNSNISKTYTKSVNPILVPTDNIVPFLRLVPTPKSPTSMGLEGYTSYDSNYFYVFTNGKWKRTAISEVTNIPTNPIDPDNTSPFLRVVSVPKTQIPGGESGYVSYDSNYFYIYTRSGWKRVAISDFTDAPSSEPLYFNNIYPFLQVVATPTNQLTGTEGTVSFDEHFFYLYSNGLWKQLAISQY